MVTGTSARNLLEDGVLLYTTGHQTRVITNEGWKIPNMKDIMQRIGSLKPNVFGVGDLTQGFY